MTAPVDYEWLPAVYADHLQAGDRVTEFADFVTSAVPSDRRPDVMDVTFAETGGMFHIHVTEIFHVQRPVTVADGPDDDEDDDGQQHDEAAERW